jgi:hypothetical protein
MHVSLSHLWPPHVRGFVGTSGLNVLAIDTNQQHNRYKNLQKGTTTPPSLGSSDMQIN